jgi:hypothetical protein
LVEWHSWWKAFSRIRMSAVQRADADWGGRDEGCNWRAVRFGRISSRMGGRLWVCWYFWYPCGLAIRPVLREGG